MIDLRKFLLTYVPLNEVFFASKFLSEFFRYFRQKTFKTLATGLRSAATYEFFLLHCSSVDRVKDCGTKGQRFKPWVRISTTASAQVIPWYLTNIDQKMFYFKWIIKFAANASLTDRFSHNFYVAFNCVWTDKTLDTIS